MSNFCLSPIKWHFNLILNNRRWSVAVSDNNMSTEVMARESYIGEKRRFLRNGMVF